MKQFHVVVRGKKYWVEEIEDGTQRIVVGFATEEAAVRCANDLQESQHTGERSLQP